MSIAILIRIVWHNGLAPVGSALEIDVVNVCASVYNINVNTLTTISSVKVFVVGAEG